MTDLRKAAEMALEAWDKWTPAEPIDLENKIEALRQALEQPQQESAAYTGNGTAGREADVRPTGFFFQMPKPIGEVYGWHGTGKGQPMCRFNASEAEMPVGTKLYTAPPKQEWVGLTDDEIYYFVRNAESYLECAKGIEAKLKEKNT